VGYALRENVMKLLCGVTSLVNPEASFTQLRQALPPDVQLITTTNFDDVSDQDLEGVEAIATALAPVTDELMGKLPKLRIIQACSHGFDHIDIQSARRRGIPVCNVGSSGAEDFDVAELAMLFMLALSRRLVEANQGLRQGEWNQPHLLSHLGLTELHGKTLGVVGLGEIGTDLAFKARGEADCRRCRGRLRRRAAAS